MGKALGLPRLVSVSFLRWDHVQTSAYSQKRVSDPRELESQMGCEPLWLLEAETMSSASALNPLSHLSSPRINIKNDLLCVQGWCEGVHSPLPPSLGIKLRFSGLAMGTFSY